MFLKCPAEFRNKLGPVGYRVGIEHIAEGANTWFKVLLKSLKLARIRKELTLLNSSMLDNGSAMLNLLGLDLN